ncbi:glycosyltransferase family 87 protein [Nevskia soli]|uniref:glycosyltransferase family 87 protein n=1 Tax=Nevskia soli TaxID=418856 RepID=UPI0014707CA9|nr:glycosyltransferase family 87 protein [Nevskia soli]
MATKLKNNDQQGSGWAGQSHWLRPARLSLYAAAFLAIYLMLGVFAVVHYPHGTDSTGHSLRPDFLAFWGASHIALTGDAAKAYELESIVEAERTALPGYKGVCRWIYPPTFYLLVLPLALLSLLPSYLLFMAVTLLGYLTAVHGILLTQRLVTPGSWLLLLGFPAVAVNLFKGQNGLLTVALMGAALLLLQQRRPLWAGMFVGLLTIKPQLGVLLPIALICGREWRALGAATVTAIVFLGLSTAVLGIDSLRAFLHGLPVFSAWAAQATDLLTVTPTIFSFLRLLGVPYAPALALHGLAALAVAASVVWTWRKCGEFSLRAAVLVVGSLLISPYIVDYDLAWLALALAWFCGYAARHGWRAWERETLVLLWLLPILLVPIHSILGLQFAPFIMLAFLLMLLRRVHAETGASAPSGSLDIAVTGRLDGGQ